MVGNIYPDDSILVLTRRPLVTTTEEVLESNASYAESFDKGSLPMPPARGLAVVACMDARLDTHKLLGLDEGDAHVIRNAGGVISDDVVRSLVISQRLLGTREIVLIHHTDCGMLTFRDDAVKDAIEADTGLRPAFALEAFGDLEQDVRQSLSRIQANPFIPLKDQVRGFIYDCATGPAQRGHSRLVPAARHAPALALWIPPCRARGGLCLRSTDGVG